MGSLQTQTSSDNHRPYHAENRTHDVNFCTNHANRQCLAVNHRNFLLLAYKFVHNLLTGAKETSFTGDYSIYKPAHIGYHYGSHLANPLRKQPARSWKQKDPNLSLPPRRRFESFR